MFFLFHDAGEAGGLIRVDPMQSEPVLWGLEWNRVRKCFHFLSRCWWMRLPPHV